MEQEIIEQSETDETAARILAAKEVYGDLIKDDPITSDEVTPGDEPTAKADETDDPWAGVSSALRSQFDSMAQKVQVLDQLSYQVKQAERRIGSLQNELSAAKKAEAAIAAKAPTSEQLAEAVKTKAGWDNMMEEYPEIAKAVDGRISEKHSEIKNSLPDIKAIVDEVENKALAEKAGYRSEVDNLKIELEKTKIAVRHPDWENTIKTPEYIAWTAAQTPENQAIIKASRSAKECTAMLDRFVADTNKKPIKSASEINAERQQRLKRSQAVQGRHIPPPKSDEDLTELEMRQKIAKKIWPKG